MRSAPAVAMIGILGQSCGRGGRAHAPHPRACKNHAGFVIGYGGLLLATAVIMLQPAVAEAQDAREARVDRTKTLMVSSLDPTLPDVSLETWLQEVIGANAGSEWTAGSCAGRREPDNPAVPLCGIVAVTRGDATVTIGVKLGVYDQASKADRLEAPRLDEAYVSRGRKVVMLDGLGDLARMIALPESQWPRPNIQLEAIRCLPERPTRIERVTCSMTLVNRGAASSFARVFVDVQSDYSQAAGELLKVAAGERRTLRIMFAWPAEEGAAASAGIELKEPRPYHRVNERGETVLTRGEELPVPYDLLDLEDGSNAPQLIVSARVTTSARPSATDVPVDSSISRLVVSIESPDGVPTTFVRPGGAVVREEDEGVTLSDVRSLDLKRQIRVDRKVFTIERPQPGVWRVEIPGTVRPGGADVAVTASGTSPIDFADFEFVRLQDGVHGGYFRIDGMPLSGVPATAQARVSSDVREPRFRMIDERGTSLGSAPLAKGLPRTGTDDFIGTFDLPSVPFQVVMNGTDASGAPVQRQHGLTYRAQPVALFFHYGRSTVIEPGTAQRLTFSVMNTGSERATFALDVATDSGQILDLSPRTVTVEPRTSATPSFSLSLPAKGEYFGQVVLRMTATSTADPEVKNTLTAHLEVSREGDADGDYVEDAKDNCRNVTNHDQEDRNKNGIGDACDPAEGPAVTIRRLLPQSGGPGTTVTVSGSGFRIGTMNFVMMNGMSVPAVAASATEMTFVVPADAPPGPVVLIFVNETSFVMSPIPFLVVPRNQEKRR